MKLGQRQNLKVTRIKEQGAYLSDGQEEVLLPKKEIEDLKENDQVNVFIYKDSKDRLIATKRQTKIEVGQIKELEIVAKSKVGYFADMGLEKDIFLPYKEVMGRIRVGEKCLFYMYVDRDRLCITMKLGEHLLRNDHYKVNDIVEGTIYALERGLGAFVAIENKYDGFIPQEELKGAYRIGDTIEARVQRILRDKKITLTIREKAYKQIGADADEILKLIKENGGTLNLGDKSKSEEIKKITGLSKSAFKRALGHLYKNEFVDLYPEKVVLRDW